MRLEVIVLQNEGVASHTPWGDAGPPLDIVIGYLLSNAICSLKNAISCNGEIKIAPPTSRKSFSGQVPVLKSAHLYVGVNMLSPSAWMIAAY